ncbi:hypothetical protein AMATHDRAFT_61899 [Amanita thiersii Skay4041]|uniref:Alpha-ketoglutarate-dependent dioxygenase AlkB-like domain-containing protein n=1 Tax=Amanita thiersii Skay4041 TaxID=703135 RepID=A0A2A9NQU0_9AGAR|nr:hypothetical protein AMATHDRAFT_61899 [Amanita thiersii Skay4041]
MFLFTRSLATLSTHGARQLRPHFHFWPDLFSPTEQRLLLFAALHMLDSNESRQFQRRRKRLLQSNEQSVSLPPKDVSDLFLPDQYYDFEEGHYDGVIHHFREMHLSSWPSQEGLSTVLNKLYAMCPTQGTQTHLLHLSTRGQVLPHIDNVSASGSWIMGLSLGAQRVLRMESIHAKHDCFDVLLPSGSLYLQKDDLRYQYKHSIIKDDRHPNTSGQRLSVMIRDSCPRA